jgi:predicted lipoprotein with Yx(FWY)xxD motif
MRHPRTTIAAIGVAAVAGISGIAVAATTGGSTVTAASSKAASTAAVPAAAPSVISVTDPTIHTMSAMVDGKTETILVNAGGLPLYFYKPDTGTKSFVSGALASLWPPLVSAHPTISGAAGKVSVTNDANGAHVAYKGHFLYTFLDDSAGSVSGQGVQDFFVATPGLAAIGAGSTTTATATATTMAPASQSGGIYGY